MYGDSVSKEIEEKLPRNLGLWGIWLLVVNGLIGAGIFGLPSGATRLAGEYSVFVYILCALLILPVILSFAEVSSYFRSTGGPMRYGTAAFGKFIGFQSGWLYYVARLISFSANSVLLVDSIAYFIPSIGEGVFRVLALALLFGGMTLLNVLGSTESIRSLALITVLKFLVLLFLVFGGILILGDELLPSFNTSPLSYSTDLGAAALLLIYAYVGFEGAVVPAGETKNPARDIPWALILGLLVVAGLYMLIQIVSQTAIPGIADSTTPLLDVSASLFGSTGALILMTGVVASVGGNLVGAIFSTPRVTYAMALDKTLPVWFGKVHSRFMTPSNSIIFFGLLGFSIAVFGSFIWLAAMTVLSRLFFYILTCAAIPILRPRYRTEKSFILKGGYTIPILAIISCLWLMLQVSINSIMMTGLFILLGSVLYFLASKPRKE